MQIPREILKEQKQKVLIHVVYTFSLLGMPKIKTRKTKFIKIIYDLVGKKVFIVGLFIQSLQLIWGAQLLNLFIANSTNS